MSLERLSESERGVLRCANGTFVHDVQMLGKEKMLSFSHPVDIHLEITEKVALGHLFVPLIANAYVARLQPEIADDSYKIQFYQVSRNSRLREYKGI